MSDYTPPQTWNSLMGKPFVTVSPSKTPDGSDYGAFTPGTTTSGIQEALNAVLSGGTIRLLPGTFVLRAAVSATITDTVTVVGAGMGASFVQLSSSLSTAGPYFDITINTTSSYDGPGVHFSDFSFDFNGVSLSGSNTTDAFNLSVSSLNPIVQASWERVSFQRQAFSQDGTAGGYCIQLVGIQVLNIIISGCVFGNATYGLVGDVIRLQSEANADNSSAFPGTIVRDCYFTNIAQGTYGGNPCIVLLGGQRNVSITNCTYAEINSTPVGRFLDLFFTGSDTSFSDISVSNCWVSGSKYFVTYDDLADNLTGNSVSSLHIYDSGFSGANSPSFEYRNTTASFDYGVEYKGNIGYNPQGFGITTPSVPTSGTAQANTFPHPVRVYLLTGGTGTDYTITDPSGNSEKFAVTLTAGMEITLDPGASITLTYSSAPTWVWYGV